MRMELILIAMSLVSLLVIALARKPITWRSIKARIEDEWHRLSSQSTDENLFAKDDFTRLYKREIVRQLWRHSAAITFPALIAIWFSSMAYLVILPMTVLDLVVWCVVAVSAILLFAFMASPRYFLDEENYYFERARVRVISRMDRR
jgi:hypothetical protein